MTTEPLTLTASAPSQTEEIYYPETDGMPLPDGPEQEPQYREAVSILENQFKGPRTFVSGNTFIYYVEGDASRRFAPDCYVVFDVDMTSIDRRNTYLVWEVGKPPDFAMEIGSRSTGGNDLGTEARLVRESWNRRVLAVRPDGRRLLRRAARWRTAGGWRVRPIRDAARA